MNKIFNWIAKNLDKICHFLASSLIVVVFCGILTNVFNLTFILSIIISTIFTIVVGVSKELIDKYCRSGIFDKNDLLADLIGLTFGIIILIIIL